MKTRTESLAGPSGPAKILVEWQEPGKVSAAAQDGLVEIRLRRFRETGVVGATGTATVMSSKFIQRGGLWVAGQSGLLFAVVILGVVFHGDGKNLLIMVGGAVFFVVALGCGLAGTIALGRNLTPFPKPSTHTQLVQGGIYGLMRHPLYTAVFCGSVGWALVWQSWPALLATLVIAPFFDAKARREERWLKQPFPEYASYEQRVRRFIPWIY